MLESSADERERLIVAWQSSSSSVFSLHGGGIYKVQFPQFQQARLWNSNHVLCDRLFFKASSSRALNYFMAQLYVGDVWLEASKAGQIAAAGRHFLMAYSRLASLSHSCSELRFTLLPKLHMLWHVVDQLQRQHRALRWVENPMIDACAIDEDFIGRYCALTRAVSPRQRMQRSLERYLTHVILLWRRK